MPAPTADADASGTGLFAGDHRRSRRFVRWVKPIVSIALYAAIFFLTDAGAIVARVRAARFEYVAAGVALYATGQAISAWKWYLLLRPVQLRVPYRRMLAFYFIGMFFNLFLPTIVGGDAVKALLLARETGAPARSAVAVFMERNLGLLALLSIAVVAAWMAPRVELLGFSLGTLTTVLLVAFLAVNLVLTSRGAYALVDRVIAATPLARFHPRALSLYRAITPYTSAGGVVMSSIALSFAFQCVVIAVVFLNARALNLDFPLTAVAVFVPLISLGGMIPVSVNGLGVREALYILLFGRLGAPAELSVSLALLYLAVTVATGLPGGIVYALQSAPVRLDGSREAAGDPH
jgi:glycosyltransferase 2 family protein